MKHDDLVEFLAVSAAELVRDADDTDAKRVRRDLDEAAELLCLGASLLARRAATDVRKAA